MDIDALKRDLPRLCVAVNRTAIAENKDDTPEGGLGAVVAKPSQLWPHGTVGYFSLHYTYSQPFFLRLAI